MILNTIKRRVRLRKRYRLWRKMNVRNNTAPMNDFNQSIVKVGDYTYGGIRVYNFNKNHRLTIGRFCSIADDVMFILDADHRTDLVSTYPFKVNITKEDEFEAISKGDIIVDDDVWIGYGATILSGVHIGQGAVIAAGAVVSKDVEPYSIVGGVPAKIVKYRFSQKLISFLLTLDYSSLTENIIKEHIEDLYKDLEVLELGEIVDLFDWFPKKIL